VLFSRNKDLHKITASLKAGDNNMDNLIDESELQKAGAYTRPLSAQRKPFLTQNTP
jgi:hypothetical protein